MPLKVPEVLLTWSVSPFVKVPNFSKARIHIDAASSRAVGKAVHFRDQTHPPRRPTSVANLVTVAVVVAWTVLRSAGEPDHKVVRFQV
jgi:hypothetical protein